MRAKTLVLVLLASLSVAAFAPGDGTPVFSNPTLIDNPYAPFQPGSVTIFRGKTDGGRTATLFTHLEATRVFDYAGGQVECRVLQEQDFLDGVLVEVSISYLAQDDLGNVQFFGEVSWEYQAGVLVGAEEDSWLVGGATLPTDPPEAYNATDPAMFMPATLQPGDTFVMQQIPGKLETITVLADGQSLKVPAGKFQGAMKLQELDDGEDGLEPPTIRWVVAQVGTVKEKTKGTYSALIATSVVENE